MQTPVFPPSSLHTSWLTRAIESSLNLNICFEQKLKWLHYTFIYFYHILPSHEHFRQPSLASLISGHPSSQEVGAAVEHTCNFSRRKTSNPCIRDILSFFILQNNIKFNEIYQLTLSFDFEAIFLHLFSHSSSVENLKK